MAVLAGTREYPVRMTARRAAMFTVWLVIGVFFGLQLYSFRALTASPIKLYQAMTWELARWGTWAVLFFPVAWMARRYPLRERPRTRAATMHIAASVAASLVHVVIYPSVIALFMFVGELFMTTKPLAMFLADFGRHAGPEFSKAFSIAFTTDFHIGVLVYCAIVVVEETLRGYRRAAQLETQLATSQLEALKMQLEPHFLFNTLNSIAALIRRRPEVAENMVAELAEFLRLTLENGGTQETPLRDELQFVTRYLNIERVRFHDRLSTTVDASEDALNAQVPNLVLQPIVENAIRHGIAPHAESGAIAIRARCDGTLLRIEVSDDGAGPRNAVPISEGIGLRNTRSRLQQLYGSSASLRLEPADGRGMRAVVEIPFHTQPLAPAGERA